MRKLRAMGKVFVLGASVLLVGAAFDTDEATAQRRGFNRADFKIRGRFANVNPQPQRPQYYAPAPVAPSTGQSYQSFSYEPGAAPAPMAQQPVYPSYGAAQVPSCCAPWPHYYYYRPSWK